jgi:hypothetical protein
MRGTDKIRIRLPRLLHGFSITSFVLHSLQFDAHTASSRKIPARFFRAHRCLNHNPIVSVRAELDREFDYYFPVYCVRGNAIPSHKV